MQHVIEAHPFLTREEAKKWKTEHPIKMDLLPLAKIGVQGLANAIAIGKLKINSHKTRLANTGNSDVILVLEQLAWGGHIHIKSKSIFRAHGKAQ